MDEPVESKHNSEDRSLLLVGGVVVFLLFTWNFMRWDLLVDDAFISFRYAENLVERGQLVYNPGERVEGYSNFLWTVLLAGLGALGAAPPSAAPALGYALGLVALGAIYLSARRVLGYAPLPSLLAAGLAALSISWTFWAGAGMESVLFSLLLLVLWATVWSKLATRPFGPALLAVPAAALALTRPEGVIVLLALPIALWVFRHMRGRPLLWGTLALLLLVGAHLAWRYSYYGALFPNPYHAKVSPTLAALTRGAGYLWGFLWEEALLFLLPLIAYARRRDARYLTLCTIVLVYAAFIVYVGGDGLYRYRLLAHVTPCLALALAAGLDRLWQNPGRAAAAVTLAAAGIVIVPLASGSFFRNYSIEAVRDWEQRWTLVGQSLHQSTPAGLRIATNVAGRVPYYSRRPTLDLLGLTDPVIARSEVAGFGSGYAGHERAAPAYVLERRPELVYLSVLDGLPRPAFRNLAANRAVLGAGSLFRYVPLLQHPRFRDEYAPAFLRLSDGRWANVFVSVEAKSELTSDQLQVVSWNGQPPVERQGAR